MQDVLTITEIRAWLKKHFTGGSRTQVDHELPMRAFCAATGLHDSNLYGVRDGTRKLDPKNRHRVSRFILDWEAGLLEFGRGGKTGRARFLIHRQTPKPRAMRLKVSWIGGAKLERVQVARHDPRIPMFRDIFAGLDKRKA